MITACPVYGKEFRTAEFYCSQCGIRCEVYPTESDMEEMEDRIDDYFENVSDEQLLEDLKKAGYKEARNDCIYY